MNYNEPKSKNAVNYCKAHYSLSVSTALSPDVVEVAGSLSDKTIVLGETTKERIHVQFRVPTTYVPQLRPRLQHSNHIVSMYGRFYGTCFKNV